MVNLLQLLRYMTLFTLYFPKILLSWVAYIGIVNFENEFFEYLFLVTVNEDKLEHHETHDYRFDILSIESNSILISGADMFMYLIFFTWAFTIIFIITYLTKPKVLMPGWSWWKQKVTKFINYLHDERALFISILIRVGLEIYLDCLFSSTFNVFNMSYKNSTDSMSSLVSLAWFLLMIAFGVLITLIVIYARKDYTDSDLKTSKIKSLYSSMSKGSKYAMYLHVIFIACRVFLVMLVLSFYHLGEVQVSLFCLMLMAIIVFKLIVKPYDSKLKNIQDMIGSFLLLTLWWFYFAFIDDEMELASEGKGQVLGIICVIIICTMIFYFYIFGLIAVAIKYRARRKLSKVRDLKTLGK